MSSYPSNSQGGYSQPGYSQPDPNAILNQCRDVDNGINSVENYIEQMNTMYRRIISDADPTQENALRAQADDLASQTKNLYRNLIDRMKSIKKMPDAGSPRNSPQIGRVERRLKTAIGSYQKVQTDFRKGLEQQMRRQYRIVRPDATDAEVQEAVQDTSNQQIFSQAVRRFCLRLLFNTRILMRIEYFANLCNSLSKATDGAMLRKCPRWCGPDTRRSRRSSVT